MRYFNEDEKKFIYPALGAGAALSLAIPAIYLIKRKRNMPAPKPSKSPKTLKNQETQEVREYKKLLNSLVKDNRKSLKEDRKAYEALKKKKSPTELI